MVHGKLMQLFLVLHNIRSVINVGSIFRTADAAGVSKIYLTGYTPAPIDRFERKRKDFAKASLGADNFIAWESRDIFELLDQFKREGIAIVAIEQTADSIDYKKFIPNFPIAIILGNEVEGIEEDILKHSDATIDIPMYGQKESLNVSVAAGIILYRLLDS